MKTLNWKHTGWFAKNFIFTLEQQIFGQLTFDSAWDFSALYNDKEIKLKFAQKSFWDRDVSITKDGKTVGEIHIGLFAEQALKLVTGERFVLSTSLWEQEAYWKNDEGDTVVQYQQAPMSSMGSGLITSNGTLTVETEKLLISSGVYARKLTHKRRALIIAILIPIFAAASQQ